MTCIDNNFFKVPHTKDNLIFNTGKSSDIRKVRTFPPHWHYLLDKTQLPVHRQYRANTTDLKHISIQQLKQEQNGSTKRFSLPTLCYNTYGNLGTNTLGQRQAGIQQVRVSYFDCFDKTSQLQTSCIIERQLKQSYKAEDKMQHFLVKTLPRCRTWKVQQERNLGKYDCRQLFIKFLDTANPEV